jgi:hypothetical protein
MTDPVERERQVSAAEDGAPVGKGAQISDVVADWGGYGVLCCRLDLGALIRVLPDSPPAFNSSPWEKD